MKGKLLSLMTIKTNFTILEKIKLWWMFGHWIPDVIDNAKDDDSSAAYVVKLNGHRVFIAWERAKVLESLEKSY